MSFLCSMESKIAVVSTRLADYPMGYGHNAGTDCASLSAFYNATTRSQAATVSHGIDAATDIAAVCMPTPVCESAQMPSTRLFDNECRYASSF